MIIFPFHSAFPQSKMTELLEACILISQPPLNRKNFNKESRQNLKKMRPSLCKDILSQIAERRWDGVEDITKEVHRLVSFAKANDKFSSPTRDPQVPRFTIGSVLL